MTQLTIFTAVLITGLLLLRFMKISILQFILQCTSITWVNAICNYTVSYI